MMFRRRSDLIERFIARHLEDPRLTVQRFASEVREPSARERRDIERYLRTANVLATLAPTTSSGPPEPVASVHHLIGRSVDGYRLDELIGRGGTGGVFKASTRAGDTVAVKVLHPAFASDPARLARFRHEAATLRRLRHPNIVSVIGAGESDGLAYIVMEHIDGEGLDALLTRGSAPRSTADRARQTAQIGVALADALAHAHDHGLVHRDVKPGNVLLHASGHVYLLDFGFAHDAAQSKLTGSAELLGTLVYMAPEQRDPVLGPVDARTDVFGLGLTLFEIATGRRPYAERGYERLVSVPGLPGRLAAVLLQAIDPDSRRRYASASALRDDLQRFLDGRAVEARHPGMSARMLRWVGRHALVAAAGITVCAVVGSLFVVSWQRSSIALAALTEAGALLTAQRTDEAARAFARAREYGADDAAFAQQLATALQRERAERDFAEVRYLVADPDATKEDLQRADQVCVDVMAVRAERDRFEPLLVQSLIAFLRGDVMVAAKLGMEAARVREVPLSPGVVAAMVAFAADMRKQVRGSDVLRQLVVGERFYTTGLDRLLQQLGALRAQYGANVPEIDPFYAVLLSASGQPERGLEILEQAIERDPRHPSPMAVLFKVLALKSRGEPRLALEVLRNAIATNPDSAGLYGLRARLYWSLGDAAHAYVDTAQALRLQPALRGPRLLAAETLLALDRPQEARAAAERLLTDEPEHAQGQHLLARACARVGDVRTAILAANTSLRLMARCRLTDESLRRETLLDLMLWSSGYTGPVETDAARRTRLEQSIAGCLPSLRCDEEDLRQRLQLAALHVQSGESEAACGVLAAALDDVREVAARPPEQALPRVVRTQLRRSAQSIVAELETGERFGPLRGLDSFSAVVEAWQQTLGAIRDR